MRISGIPAIAIVDDDAAMREALCDLLVITGFSLVAYATAQGFLADLTPGRFDLLITDLRMPGLDGIELLRRLRATGITLPAIVVTSSSDAQTRAQAIREGAQACLVKPVSDNVLLHWIGKALGAP